MLSMIAGFYRWSVYSIQCSVYSMHSALRPSGGQLMAPEDQDTLLYTQCIACFNQTQRPGVRRGCRRTMGYSTYSTWECTQLGPPGWASTKTPQTPVIHPRERTLSRSQARNPPFTCYSECCGLPNLLGLGLFGIP